MKYSEYCKQAKTELFGNAISLYIMSHILCQGIAVFHSKELGQVMSDDINHCHLCRLYVSDDLKTCGTFFPIEPIPLDGPFHPDHPDNNHIE